MEDPVPLSCRYRRDFTLQTVEFLDPTEPNAHIQTQMHRRAKSVQSLQYLHILHVSSYRYRFLSAMCCIQLQLQSLNRCPPKSPRGDLPAHQHPAELTWEQPEGTRKLREPCWLRRESQPGHGSELYPAVDFPTVFIVSLLQLHKHCRLAASAVAAVGEAVLKLKPAEFNSRNWIELDDGQHLRESPLLRSIKG